MKPNYKEIKKMLIKEKIPFREYNKGIEIKTGVLIYSYIIARLIHKSYNIFRNSEGTLVIYKIIP